MGITQPFVSDFDVQQHLKWLARRDKSNANRTKLYPRFLVFGFLVYSLLQVLTWATLGLWTQNHPQVVGKCPGHGPQLIALLAENGRGRRGHHSCPKWYRASKPDQTVGPLSELFGPTAILKSCIRNFQVWTPSLRKSLSILTIISHRILKIDKIGIFKITILPLNLPWRSPLIEWTKLTYPLSSYHWKHSQSCDKTTTFVGHLR